jgi:hypothetical protein
MSIRGPFSPFAAGAVETIANGGWTGLSGTALRNGVQRTRETLVLEFFQSARVNAGIHHRLSSALPMPIVGNVTGTHPK